MNIGEDCAGVDNGDSFEDEWNWTQIQPTTDSSMSAALVTVIQAMMVLTMRAVSAMQTQATIVLRTATES